MYKIQTTEIFDVWFAALTDRAGKARIQARIDRAEYGHLGDCAPVGEGVSEMRIHFGPGYRIYYKQRGIELIVIMVGGDKSTQKRDIQSALHLARNLGK